ncbi:MAG: UDP-N-acetylglucosamine 2-epimerase (non-hydrolyzing) [Anaerolineales bacterium]|nr:MAG: UDP-N-acetylglucosamine 2-epimerase (non-hydrolyzing) [Anaerolineales bacterium]
MKVLSVFGTRPEAIKMAPVVKELQRRDDRVVSRVCVTAQHREMLDDVLDLFGLRPDHDLDIMSENQSAAQVAAAAISRLAPVLEAEQPDWVLLQGDTTTVAAAALAAYYARVKVGHVEAGLRTFDKWQPFPEEMNRRVASVVADLHFAPTERARANLLREGVNSERVVVSGNPVIDALRWAAELPFQFDAGPLAHLPLGKPIILVTAHRRENFGPALENICAALLELAGRFGDRVHIVYPVHLNPNVRRTVYGQLDGAANITLLPPLDYLSFVHLMKRSHLVLTDSGGIQEEAPSLGKPVLVLREVTERPEAVEAGAARVIGTNQQNIVHWTERLLQDPVEYSRMAQAVNPYGDGHAAERIVEALLR